MMNLVRRFFHSGFSLPFKRSGVSVFCRRGGRACDGESGFVLVLAVVILLVLTLLGIWALRTSDFELNVVGGSQQAESQLNIGEGAVYNEVVNMGFRYNPNRPYYALPDTSVYGLVLQPTTTLLYNPGNYLNLSLPATIMQNDPTSWPYDNLLGNYSNTALTNQMTYRYLTTYLIKKPPPAGSGTGTAMGYYFRFQGGPVSAPTVIEVGGCVLGSTATD
jgi:hypothetical protein